MSKSKRLERIKELIALETPYDKIVSTVAEEMNVQQSTVEKDIANTPEFAGHFPDPKEVLPEPDGDGLIWLWHPMNGKKGFNPVHAKRLWELEKTHPSGWQIYSNQEQT